MLAQGIVAVVIGALVGGAMGAFGTRNPRYLLLYMLLGSGGALLYTFLPALRGNPGAFNSAPKTTAIAAGLIAGLGILFTSGKRK